MNEEKPSQPAADSHRTPADTEQQVDEIAESFLDQLQAGKASDRKAVQAAYPEIADLLEPRLAFVENLHRAARNNKASESRDSAVDTLSVPGLSADPSAGAAALAPRENRVGRYILLELLGEGASGTVYRARDPKFNRDVALKVFRIARPVGADSTERFEREGRIASQLRHPHIVPVHDTGEHEGRPYIDMALVRGESLESRLARGPVAFRDAAELVRKLADALDYAHGFSIIHRDVKPANVLLDERGEPQLTDFGLARREVGELSITEDGQILGTPAYMSPEQAGGGSHQADRRTDVYGLGAVLYRLLTDRVPFPAVDSATARDGVAAQVYRVVHTDPVRPRTLNPAIPRDLETICMKALAKEPEARFPSAAALAEELRRWLNDEALRIRRPTWWERTRRWARRNRLAARTLAASLFLGISSLVLVGVAWMQHQRVEEALAAKSREESLRAEIEARSLLEQARQRVNTPTMGRRTETLDLLRRLAEVRRNIHDAKLGERLDLQARSVLVEALGVPDLVIAERTELPEWPFAEWRTAMHPSGQQMAVGTLAGPMLWKRGHSFRRPAAPQLGQRPPRLAYSPHGSYLAFAAAEGGLQVWDEEVSHVLAERKPSEIGSVLALGFAPGRKTLWVCCADGQVQSLSLPDLRTVMGWRIDAPSQRLVSAAFNAAATRLAVGDKGGQVRLYTADGTFLPPARSGRVDVAALAWSPDSRLVAVGTKDGIVQLWPAEDSGLLQKSVLGTVPIGNLQFSPDGRWIAAGQGWISSKVWDVATGAQLLTAAYVPSGFSHDGGSYAGSRNTELAFCDFLIPRTIRRLAGHRAGVAKLAWSRDNRHLVSVDSSFEVRVWDVDRAASLDDFLPPVGGFFAENAAVALSDDGRQTAFASGGDTEAHALIRDLPTGKTVGEWPLPGGFERLACVGGNKFVLVREELDEDKANVHTVALELEAGQPASDPRSLRASQAGDRRGFFDCDLTPDGRYYWWLGPRLPKDSCRVEIRDVGTGKLILEKRGVASSGHPSAFLSSDGQHLWATNDGTDILHYRLPDASLPTERVAGVPVAFSPSSRWQVLRVVPDDLRPFHAVAFRRLEEDRTWLELPSRSEHEIRVASFSDDGRYLALGHSCGVITVVDVPALQRQIADFEKTLPK
jgi:WD40 repeat protein/tRNA A-37 threonylcarbamoyl transferase component Bud32